MGFSQLKLDNSEPSAPLSKKAKSRLFLSFATFGRFLYKDFIKISATPWALG
jgi:hypothetical protein